MARKPDLSVVPSELVLLSRTFMAEAQHVDDAWRATEPGLQLDRGVAGDAPAGAELVDDHAVCAESAAPALGFLGEILEVDMDTLLRVAFDFSGADEAAATAFNQRAVQVASTPPSGA